MEAVTEDIAAQIEEPFSVAIPIPSHDRDMIMTAQIEEPFSILPLIKCHKWLLTDVRRTQALVRNLSCDPAAGTAAAAKSLANRQSESSS